MNIFFDSIIILYLIASVTFAVAVFRDRKKPNTWESRHPFITFTVFLLLCLSALVMIWGSFIEPRLITINRASVDLPNFEPSQPIQAAFISDMHVGTYKKDGWVRKVSNRIIDLDPDLVLITGDFIVDKPEQAQYLSAFSNLKSPVYAVLGDHEYQIKRKQTNKPGFTETYSPLGNILINKNTADTVANALTAIGINVLRNDTETITLNNATLTLVGLDDWNSGQTSMPQIENPNIVLIHNPDFVLDPESKKAGLILSGHSHGGQIRLPFIGPVPALPLKLPRSYDQGLFEITPRTKLFITSGLGESGPRARLFNPPEVVLLELY